MSPPAVPKKLEASHCIYCGKFFHRKEHVARHMTIHEGVKPYKCPICHMDFNRQDILRRHLSIHGKAAGGTPIPIPGGGARSAGRTPNACENCARSKTKCEPSESTSEVCKRCSAKGLTCVLRPGRRNARRKTDASEDSILKAQLDAKDDSQNQQELMNENRELQEENRRKQLELEQARQQLQQLQSQQQQTQHPQLQDISQLQNQASWDVTAFLDQRSPTFSDPNMNTYQQGFPSPGIPTPPSDTSAYDQFFPSTGISSHSRSTSLNFSPPNGMLSPETVNGYMNQMNFSGFSNEADNMLNATAFSQDFSDDLAAATSQVHLWSDASPDQRMDPSAQYFDDMAPYYGGFG